MKKLLLSLLAISLLLGCSTDEISTSRVTPNPGKTGQMNKSVRPIAEDITRAMQDFDKLVAANRTRLAASARSRKACMSHIEVPRHFNTIQEAVDNACDGAVITVKSGTYTEVVVVEKPGIKFKANGEVILQGGFVLNEGADHTTIQQFTIHIGAGAVHGINARHVTGGKIFQNTLSNPFGVNGTAVRYYNASHITVHGNTISGTSWGILFGALENGSSHYNTISKNYITGINKFSVIGLQGNCDNNFINENTLMNNPSLSNAGITLFSGDNVFGFCDNNVAKNNISSNGYVGALIFNGGTNNKIGPYNTLNNNAIYGISVLGNTSGNLIYKNTAQGNGLCDILNAATDLLSNTFTDNTAGCTIGL